MSRDAEDVLWSDMCQNLRVSRTEISIPSQYVHEGLVEVLKLD